MKIENKYVVVKRTDLYDALSTEERVAFLHLIKKVQNMRDGKSKPMTEGIFIDKRWPEYEPTLQLLSNRVDGENRS